MKAINDIYETSSLVVQEEVQNAGNFYREEITDVNITRTHNALKIEISVPVTNCEPYKIKVDKGILTVSGARIFDFELNLLHVVGKEFSYGHFYGHDFRTEHSESEKIQVSSRHGLLMINIPKKELIKKTISEISVN